MQWSDTEQFLVDLADADLVARGQVDPCLVAYCGEQPLFSAWLRSFVKGEYHDPVIELLALAGAMAADRLALSMSGRAWSWEDPIPPVVHGVGDLRQRVLHILFVDGASGTTTEDSVIYPFSLDATTVRWQPRMQPGPSQGWLQQALRMCVDNRAQLQCSDGDIAQQAVRCLRLGHEIAWPSDVAAESG